MIRKGQACESAPGPVCCTASFLVCLESMSDSFSYRTQLHSIPKLQHCLLTREAKLGGLQSAAGAQRSEALGIQHARGELNILNSLISEAHALK